MCSLAVGLVCSPRSSLNSFISAGEAGLELPGLLDIFLIEEAPESVVIAAEVLRLEVARQLRLSDEYSVLGRWLGQILASA